MPRVALSLAVALVCAPLIACAVSASSSASAGSGTMSLETGGEGRPARPVGDGGAPGTEGAGATGAGAPPPCQPALADAPTALFGTRIVVRMPKGVELMEQNGFYAQAAAPNQATNCGQAVSYVAVGFFEYPNGATTAVRDQLLEMRGIPADGVTWEDEGTRGRTYTGAYRAPADAASGAPEVRGWFVLRDAPNDKYGYFALYEADPAVFDALKPVFVASGRSLVVKPRSAPSELSAAPPPAPTPPPEPAPTKPKKGGTKVKAKDAPAN